MTQTNKARRQIAMGRDMCAIGSFQLEQNDLVALPEICVRRCESLFVGGIVDAGGFPVKDILQCVNRTVISKNALSVTRGENSPDV